MKSSKKMLFAVFFLFFINGCGSLEKIKNDNVQIYTDFQTRFNGETKSLEGFENQRHYSMGLWDNSSNDLQNSSIYLKENEEVDMFLSLMNCLGGECNFTIVILDNCKQTEFVVDGTSMRQCTVNIENQKEVFIPIKLDSLMSGRHDLIFAIFVNTYKDLTEEERIAAGNHDDALKCTFIVENDNVIQENNIEYLETNTIKARTNGAVFNKLDGKEYFLEVGNLDEEIKRNTIIFLDNFEQVSIGNMSGLHIQLNAGDEVVVSLEDYFKKIKDDEKEHEIIAICISDNDNRVFFSNRILK